MMTQTTTRQAPAMAGDKCTVEGCGGVLTTYPLSNGTGATLRCPFCERRREWAAKNVPGVPPATCVICGGPTPIAKGKKGTRRLKYCAPCRQLAKIAAYRNKQAETKATVTATRARVSGKAGR